MHNYVRASAGRGGSRDASKETVFAKRTKTVGRRGSGIVQVRPTDRGKMPSLRYETNSSVYYSRNPKAA